MIHFMNDALRQHSHKCNIPRLQSWSSAGTQGRMQWMIARWRSWFAFILTSSFFPFYLDASLARIFFLCKTTFYLTMVFSRSVLKWLKSSALRWGATAPGESTLSANLSFLIISDLIVFYQHCCYHHHYHHSSYSNLPISSSMYQKINIIT